MSQKVGPGLRVSWLKLLIALILCIAGVVGAAYVGGRITRQREENYQRYLFEAEFGFPPDVSNQVAAVMEVKVRLEMLCSAYKRAEIGQTHALGAQEQLRNNENADSESIMLWDAFVRLENELVAAASEHFESSRTLAEEFGYATDVRMTWCDEEER